MNIEVFVSGVISRVTGVDRESVTMDSNSSTDSLADLKIAGFDPASIMVWITAITQILALIQGNCNNPKLFSDNARVRRPLMLGIFQAKFNRAYRESGFTGIPRETLFQAILDEAHSGGADYVEGVVQDLRMI